MKSALKSLLCRILAITVLMLPFQTGQASMIGAGQAVSGASVQVDRDVVLNFLNRSQTVEQFQALGLDAQVARDRVAAMTDDEVGALAGKINALPAGGDVGLLLVILIVVLVWIIALSLGFYGVKSGIWGIMTMGGRAIIRGTLGGMMRRR